jgi:hypothetical protein
MDAGVPVIFRIALLAIVVPVLTNDEWAPRFNVPPVKFNVPLLVNVPLLAVKSIILPDVKVTVAPEDIVIDPLLAKLEVPLIVAIPVPLNVITTAELDACPILRPPVIASVGDVPVKFTVVPVIPLPVDPN